MRARVIYLAAATRFLPLQYSSRPRPLARHLSTSIHRCKLHYQPPCLSPYYEGGRQGSQQVDCTPMCVRGLTSRAAGMALLCSKRRGANPGS